MKNQYMFFQKQQFDDLPLDDYKLTDRDIPNTDVHIYSFECIETDSICDEPSMAKKLDELSQTLSEKYSELYITISSDSSQHFCKELYPLVVSFEIKLRQAVAISRALYEKGNVDLGSFYFDVDKKKKTLEEMDFGKIYEVVFTDTTLRERVKKLHDRNFTKEDLILRIKDLEEETLWRKLVGTDYRYIESHFLAIEAFRNDVMHSHLIDYKSFQEARSILAEGNAELEMAINNKLITNTSSFSNGVNVVNAIQAMIDAFNAAVNATNTIENINNTSKSIDLLIRAITAVRDNKSSITQEDNESTNTGDETEDE